MISGVKKWHSSLGKFCKMQKNGKQEYHKNAGGRKKNRWEKNRIIHWGQKL